MNDRIRRNPFLDDEVECEDDSFDESMFDCEDDFIVE